MDEFSRPILCSDFGPTLIVDVTALALDGRGGGAMFLDISLNGIRGRSRLTVMGIAGGCIVLDFLSASLPGSLLWMAKVVVIRACGPGSVQGETAKKFPSFFHASLTYYSENLLKIGIDV